MTSYNKTIPFQNREVEVVYFYELIPGMIDYPDYHQIELIEIYYEGRNISKLLSRESINEIQQSILDLHDSSEYDKYFF